MIKVNVPKPAGLAPGKGLQVKDAITLIDVDDFLALGNRDEKGVVISSNISLKPNGYGITVYCTQDTVEIDSKSEGYTDNEGFLPSIKFKHPGNKQEIREFKAQWIGKKVVIIVDHCDGSGKDLMGSLCNPMKIAVNLVSNKDATSNEFTFTQLMRGDDVAIYEGTVPYAEPKDVIDAASTEIALIGEGQYQLTGDATSAAIATVTGATHGLVFTLLGVTSATAPNVAASSTFILKDGTTWNATTGSQITFKAFKSGATSFVYVEQSRS